MTDEGAEKFFTVGELCDILHNTFEDPQFQSLGLIGEITSKTVRSGHVYLDLTDPDDTSLKRKSMKAIIWASTLRYIHNEFAVGDVIQVKGGLQFYTGNSSLSFIISSLIVIKSQEGENLLKKKKLLERLEKAGYLNPERKRTIPRFVNRLAIVSSEAAAGYQDILNTLERRFPVDEVRLFPAIVQGASAPASICQALKAAYAFNPDVVILARGGGAKVDLSCFDDEHVIAQIVKSTCPVITAIGHTIDVSVADRVADKVAITPTDAANCINPSLNELIEEIGSFKQRLYRIMDRHISSEELFVAECQKKLMALSPVNKVHEMEKRLLKYKEQLNNSLKSLKINKENELNNLKAKMSIALQQNIGFAFERLKGYKSILSATDVNSTLARGYAFVSVEGVPINSIKAVEKGKKIKTTMVDGSITSVVTDTVRRN